MSTTTGYQGFGGENNFLTSTQAPSFFMEKKNYVYIASPPIIPLSFLLSFLKSTSHIAYKCTASEILQTNKLFLFIMV